MDEKSVWKKEISFRRKPKAKEAPPEPGAEPTSIWKREISFKRAPAAVSDAPSEPKQSIWKKDISLGRKKAAEQPELAPPAAPEPEPVVVEPVAEETFEIVAEPPLEVHAESWTAEPELPPEPIEVAPVAIVPEPEVAEEAPTIVETPAPVVVHPPVPAAELPPVEGARSVPFWKRELAIGRRGATKPRAAKEPRAKKLKAPKQPKAAKVPAASRIKMPKLNFERGGGSSGGKKLVGLKIGASQLAAARVVNNGSAELLQVARDPLSPGIVVGGELRDPDALALALKDFFAKHKLPKRGVRLGISNNRIGVRTFDVAGVQDQKALDNAIRFRAQEALPIPIDEAVLDYQTLSETTNDDGELVRRILLVVAYREQINRYIEACKQAGIALVGIDLEAFALLRALQAPQVGAGTDPDAALVAVAIGHERSTFAVSDGRVCEFTRVLEWGGAALNVAIARALDSAPSEVEGIKRSLSLETTVAPDGLTAEQAAKAREGAQRAIQTFARELVSSLQFYQNQPGSLGIGEIVLTGGTAHLPGLAAELERLIGVHVRVGDPLARIKVSKRVGDPEQVGSLAVAIGLGIED
jgi:type IV pilus assembly protein PilM